MSKYIELRDSVKKNYAIQRGMRRAWINDSSDGREGAGINFQWPDLNHVSFIEAQKQVAVGKDVNNICPIFTYSLRNGAKVMWMGDLKTEMQQAYYDQFSQQIPHVDILFQPHHGRKSGAVPDALLEALNPSLIIIGNAPANHIDYGDSHHTITQNTSGDLVFVLETKKVHIYSQHTIPNKPVTIKYDWDYALGNNFKNASILGCSYRGTLTLE